MLQPALEEIPGIGKVERKALVMHLACIYSGHILKMEEF